jgi:hypothetical protein
MTDFQISEMTDPKIPRTADGRIIYPGMLVFICEAYSIEKFSKATVYCVLGGDNQYYCVLQENRYFDDDGNGEYWTEHVSRVFADCQQCLIAVHKIEND